MRARPRFRKPLSGYVGVPAAAALQWDVRIAEAHIHVGLVRQLVQIASIARLLAGVEPGQPARLLQGRLDVTVPSIIGNIKSASDFLGSLPEAYPSAPIPMSPRVL